MAKTILSTPKGFRDFLPSVAKQRSFVLEKMKKVFSGYGFEPLETPALEYAETLKGKYGEDEKLIYEFTDRGGRQVALRYDQTVPLSRVISQYPDLPKPFKRYQIQNVWRAENTQKGRFREFLQVDIDTIGTNSILADAEIVSLIVSTLKELRVENFKVALNDRKIFEDLPIEAIRSLDKLKKIGWEKVEEELKSKKLSQPIIDKVKNVTRSSKTPDLEQLFILLKDMGIEEKYLEFDPTLARGLDYYTGLLWETFIEGYSAGAVCSGGRFDKLIKQLGGPDLPATGTSFGFDRLMETLGELNLLDKASTETKILLTVTSPKFLKNSLEFAQKLRGYGVKTEVYLDPEAKLDKQLKYADNKGIPFAAIIGEKEAKEGLITLKDLSKQSQETLSLEKATFLLTE